MSNSPLLEVLVIPALHRKFWILCRPLLGGHCGLSGESTIVRELYSDIETTFKFVLTGVHLVKPAAFEHIEIRIFHRTILKI